MFLRTALITLVTLAPVLLMAQNKSVAHYSLFNPVPKKMMRDMETDRPNITESPYTLDAGHFQYECDLVNFKRVTTETTKEHTTLINNANLKIGLARATSIQLDWEIYERQQLTDLSTGQKTAKHGAGNLTVRAKQNITGNDSGSFALAVLPYITFPTATFDDDSRYEYGLIVPMQFKLPGEWKLGMQVEADEVRNEEESGLHTELLQSLAVSHALFKHLDGMAETHYTYDLKHHEWTNYVNMSIQWKASDNLQLDSGMNYGLQSDAERNYFVGLSFRL